MQFVLASSTLGLLLPLLVSGFAVEPAGETAGRLEQARVAGLAGPTPTSPPKRRWAELFNRDINNDRTCGYFHYNDDPGELSSKICRESESTKAKANPENRQGYLPQHLR